MRYDTSVDGQAVYMPKIPEPDDGVDSDVIAQLNETFYRARPHEYFLRRLTFFALHVSRPEEVEAIFADGVEYAGVQIILDPEGSADEGEGQAQRFQTLESELLLHHVGETLLRLYLAHEGDPSPGCPWIEVTRIRDFSKFKRRIQARFVDMPFDDATSLSAPVAFGLPKAELRDPGKRSEWIAGRENVELLLRYLARVFLYEAHSYNAAKHGLALAAGEPAFNLLSETGKRILGREGPALTFLEALKRDDKYEWCETTRWIDFDLNMKITTLAVQVMKQMWMIARWRYTNQHSGPLLVEPFDKPEIRQLIAPKEAISTDRLQWMLRRPQQTGSEPEDNYVPQNDVR